MGGKTADIENYNNKSEQKAVLFGGFLNTLKIIWKTFSYFLWSATFARVSSATSAAATLASPLLALPV
jgi:hypothetical protein